MLKSICHAVACKRTTSSSSYYNRKRNSTYGAIWLALTTWASHAAAAGCSQCVIWCRWLPAALIPAQRRCLFQTPRFVLPSTADLLMDFQDHEHSCGCWKSFGTNVEFLRTPDSGKVALISPADERQHTFSVRAEDNDTKNPETDVCQAAGQKHELSLFINCSQQGRWKRHVVNT